MTASFTLRILLLALLLLALWNPRLPWQTAPVDLVVLLDASASVDAEARDRAWRQLAASLRTEPAGSRLALLRFGTRPVAELPWRTWEDADLQAHLAASAPPARLAVDDTDTDLAAALQAGLRLSQPGRDTRLVLVSDGQATRGDSAAALRLARSADLPVYFLDASAPRVGDSWIADLQAPARLPGGQRLPVTVELTSTTETEGLLQLLLDGEPVAQQAVHLAPHRPTRLTLELLPPAGTAVTLEARLAVTRDPEPRNNRRSRIVNLDQATPVLYASRATAAPALAQSLRAGGREVRLVAPQLLARELEARASGLVVLDDIAIEDLPESAWQRLQRQVTQAGTGLLVLGGPHAFAAGGYRHSTLETLLPVIAEARAPQPPAALLFVLDTSGSMDRQDGGPSRLALAREAMLETAGRLQAGDAVGLLEVAAAPRLLLPLAVRPDPVAALRRASPGAPGGGTRLAPALQQAVAVLAAAEQEQRLLVLVTDGNVESFELDAIAAAIERANIEVIALAIGSDADAGALARLTQYNGGRLLRVDRVAELPMLMRRELDQRRALLQTGPFLPEPGAMLPFLPDARDWPALPHYWVTRERAGATVHLRVQGDPLLATHFAGAGRVATLATRLDDWDALWREWGPASDFAGGLPDWLDARRGSAGLHLELVNLEGTTRLRLETDPDAPVQPGRVWVEGPGGEHREVALEALAPGRYEAVPVLDVAGRYQALVQIGEQQLSHAWLHLDEREFHPRPDGSARLQAWQDEGLLRPWPARLPRGGIAAGEGILRAPLLAIVLIAYLSLLLVERRPDLLHRSRHSLLGLARAPGSMSLLTLRRWFPHEKA